MGRHNKFKLDPICSWIETSQLIGGQELLSMPSLNHPSDLMNRNFPPLL